MSDGFEQCWEALKSNLMVEDEESLAREAWKAGREHGRCDTVMTKPITLDQAKRVLAEAGMVAVPTEANEELLNKFLTHGGLTHVLTPAGLRAAYEFMIKAAQDKPDA